MFTLAWPWVLCGLPLPWFVGRIWPNPAEHAAQAVHVPFFDQLQRLGSQAAHRGVRRSDMVCWYAVWSLLLFALSGPLHVGQPQAVERQGYNIMLVLDLSASMQMNDMRQNQQLVTRLVVVKQAAKQFIENRPYDKIGLILFGTKAYLQTPLTYDKQNVLMRIADATVGLAGNTTSIGDALGLAVKRLQHTPKTGRVIILLTDGANNSGVLAPLQAAALAQTEGIKVYTIGLGSDLDPQSFGSMFLRMNAAMDLDEDTLRHIATATGGRYFRATDMQSLSSIYQTINRLEKVKDDSAVVRPQHAYYVWPLAAACLLGMAWLVLRGMRR